MKMRMYMLIVMISAPALYAMECEDIPAELGGKEEVKGDFEYFAELPPEIQQKIALSTVGITNDVDEAFENIRNMILIDKTFNNWSKTNAFKKAATIAFYERFIPMADDIEEAIDFAKEISAKLNCPVLWEHLIPIMNNVFTEDARKEFLHKFFTIIDDDEDLKYFIYYIQAGLLLNPGLVNEPFTKVEDDEELERQIPLHWMVMQGSPPPLKIMLQDIEDEDKLSPLIQIDARNDRGFTPLQLAVAMQNVDMIRLLLKYGADPLLPIKDYGTTIAYAQSLNVDKEIINLLESAVAEQKKQKAEEVTQQSKRKLEKDDDEDKRPEKALRID